MIRVQVPLDLHSVACSGSAAFALATPLRVRELIALAVRQVIGARAPLDKFQRSVGTTLAGIAAGRFAIAVDGRLFHNLEEVVVCDRIADVRFYLSSPVRRPELAAPDR
ncbi:MAG: hypothetical protein M3Y18_01860 [Candidatus Eremiobacteraeota bacterium]|nr:hypothetical protein [Candidatus Eremiobacteraeota bacterium]